MTARKGCGDCQDSRLDFEFTMAFQPIVDLEQGQIVSHEALVRGPAGESAAYVLSKLTAENRYAFDQACRVKAIELAARLGLKTNLSINFMPSAVYEPASCVRKTIDAAARAGFPLDRLTFEIVEDDGVAEIEHLRQIIASYRHHGFKVALDDFGTGYSGILRLMELRPDIVKVDRVFVQGCENDTGRRTVISACLKLCQEFGIRVVLEGVETAAEARALRQMGARYMQGFYFARPAFEAIVTDHEIGWLDAV
jgi:EAL domain-containing protein (putative c-di-GMP-specific phosphodiesterase class I)